MTTRSWTRRQRSATNRLQPRLHPLRPHRKRSLCRRVFPYRSETNLRQVCKKSSSAGGQHLRRPQHHIPPRRALLLDPAPVVSAMPVCPRSTLSARVLSSRHRGLHPLGPVHRRTAGQARRRHYPSARRATIPARNCPQCSSRRRYKSSSTRKRPRNRHRSSLRRRKLWICVKPAETDPTRRISIPGRSSSRYAWRSPIRRPHLCLPLSHRSTCSPSSCPTRSFTNRTARLQVSRLCPTSSLTR